MHRIGEVFVTVAILTLVTSLTVADQIRRKVSGARHKASADAHADAGQATDSKRASRADSMVLHVL